MLNLTIVALLEYLKVAFEQKDKPFDQWGKHEKKHFNVQVGNMSLDIFPLLQKIADLCPNAQNVNGEPVDHFNWLKTWYMDKGLEGVNYYIDCVEAAVAQSLRNAKTESKKEDTST